MARRSAPGMAVMVRRRLLYLLIMALALTLAAAFHDLLCCAVGCERAAHTSASGLGGTCCAELTGYRRQRTFFWHQPLRYA